MNFRLFSEFETYVPAFPKGINEGMFVNKY